MEPEYQIPGTMQAATMDSFHGLDDPDKWVMEKKLDGFRLLTVWNDGKLLGYSRAHREQSIDQKLPHIHQYLSNWLRNWEITGYTVLDGELTTIDDDFSHVAGVMKSLPERARSLQEIDTEGNLQGFEMQDRRLHYAVFDMLYWCGQDTRHLPLRVRRDLMNTKHQPFLDTCSALSDIVYLTDWYPPSEADVVEWMMRGGEGAIVKNLDAPYVSNKRPPRHWYKYKAEGESDVVVMGFTDGREGKGVRRMTDTIGAICFGQYMGKACPDCHGTNAACPSCYGVGRHLVYRGQVSGMDDAMRFGFLDRAASVDTRDKYNGRVMVIRHNHVQRTGFRHPRFLHFRDDKLAGDCVWE